MKRFSFVYIFVLLLLIAGLACSGSESPVSPADSTTPAVEDTVKAEDATGEVLWGYYTVYLDTEALEAEAVPNRDVMHTLNVNTYLNQNPAGISFAFNGVTPGTGYIDVDLNVNVMHPMAGQPKFNGYDVRGAVYGNGTGILGYNSDLKYGLYGVDQTLMNPDGYTRWFNQPEFTANGVGGYTPGNYGSPGFTGSATLLGYKYFTDGLEPTADAFDYLSMTIGGIGVFSSGETNTRNYQLRFPTPSPGIRFDYAIVASWGGGQPQYHPTNADEAVVSQVDITPNLYYVDDANYGGSIIMDFALWNWDNMPDAIYIESTVLDLPYMLGPAEMTPVDQGDHFATWHVEIPADTITGVQGNEVWIIAEYAGFEYTGPYGIPNLADGPLTGQFRYDLAVMDGPLNLDPVCDVDVLTPMPAEGNSPVIVEFDASGSYDPDPGDILTYSWDFDADGIYGDTYGAGTDVQPTVYYSEDINDFVCVIVSDNNGGEAECCVHVEVDVYEDNGPPVLVSGVDGNATPGPDSIEEYSVEVTDPESDPVTRWWTITDMSDMSQVYSMTTVDTDIVSIDWANDIGAAVDDEYTINCEFYDDYNPPVEADPLLVTIQEGGIVTLFMYDGEIDDGGIEGWESSWSENTWTYCSEKSAWDESECGPYPAENSRLAITPFIEFPEAGDFTTIHIEIWHWGEMQDDEACYGSLGYFEDTGADDYDWYPNWDTDALVYIEGFDFNDGTWADWSFIFGTEEEPEWSHFDASAYAGGSKAIGFQFEEYGAANPDSYDGWNIRKLWVYYEP